MNEDMNQTVIKLLEDLFDGVYGIMPEHIIPLPGAGSHRKYFRIVDKDKSLIGSYNPDIVEHRVFLKLSKHFNRLKFPVPEVLASNPGNGTCLLQDLGDETLLWWVEKNRDTPGFRKKLLFYYKLALDDLLRFQLDGDTGLDYKYLPDPEFDVEAMRRDLNYFKYYFLKPSGITFNESALDCDFENLLQYLSAEELRGFMYRDFQARNIMLHGGMLYYIDFQGGRKGPLQYDLASLLFQVKALLPDEIREELTDYFILQLSKRVKLDSKNFKNKLKGFVLLRLLQVMGAYGYRGWFERKAHFLGSIPLLRPNLSWVIQQESIIDDLAEIKIIITRILERMDTNTLIPANKLKVSISSFSYRRGIPYDPSGHGGGFVFDCRLLPNPGRMEEFRELSGKDEPVVGFLNNEPVVDSFVENINNLVELSVASYIRAGYISLQVNFGCTGGRHRSVYCAERLAEALRSNQNITVTLKHQELPNI